MIFPHDVNGILAYSGFEYLLCVGAEFLLLRQEDLFTPFRTPFANQPHISFSQLTPFPELVGFSHKTEAHSDQQPQYQQASS
jgi:hypothetical protein